MSLINMKTKIVLAALFATCFTGMAQNNTETAPATSPSESKVPGPAAPAPVNPAPATPPPAVEPAPAPAPADPITVRVPAPTYNTNDIVPLIQIDDASLPDAIKTLARQAGINFQFDPRVVNPQPDASGHVAAPPTVSLRWENVTAMEALLALLENYHLQIVRDPKTSIVRITEKDITALEPLITQVYQLNYANPTNLVGILTNTISRGKVVADIRTSQLVISATEKEMAAVDGLIEKLDTQTKQILIEARFIEINHNPRTSKGIDWTDTLSRQNVTFGNGITTGLQTVAPALAGATTGSTPGGRSTGSPFGGGSSVATTLQTAIGGVPAGISANTANGLNPATFFLNADGVKVALSFLNTDADAKSIATPRAVTLENTPTELSVVRNIPVFEQEQGASTGSTTQPNSVKPNYVLLGPGGTFLNEVGIKLTVTPRIFGVSNVFLDLRPEISDREVKNEVTILNGVANSAPIFARRKLQTQAMIPSGYTLVLGGLRQDSSFNTFIKVPILGDIPGLGRLFRHDEKARDQRDLVIFVTPTIIESQDFQVTTNSRAFLQREPEDKVEAEWGPWDSGRPRDWTKPSNVVKTP
ncbi:MAG: secretin N-terminal domain-containing protein [Verrucomicrobiota bacterium]